MCGRLPVPKTVQRCRKAQVFYPTAISPKRSTRNKRALPTRKVTYSRRTGKSAKGNIDFNGSLGWGGEGLDNLCSVDLDGYYKVGGIKTSAFQTHKGGIVYASPSRFPGNGGGPPNRQDDEGRNRPSVYNVHLEYFGRRDNVQNNDYATETWKFTGGKEPAIITLMSEDPKKSTYGPVAGMAITKD